MPVNKNAFIRYKYLDRLLSDRHHFYDINDLTEKVNDLMERDELGMSVVRRTIEKDPYLLKQYNDRWFLLGAADSDKKILTFALDRIDKVVPLPERKYIPCPDDLAERFEDIVGVTLYEGRPVEHILCWVSDASKGYVDTKPIHGSFTPLKGDAEQQLRLEYPQLQDGMFFTLDCIFNYELIRELCSYGKELVVLSSDGTVADEVYKRISEMNKKYSELRT